MCLHEAMKNKLFPVLVVAILCGLILGCVGTVGNRRTAGVPFLKDRMAGRYERGLDEVFEATKEVIRFNGTLVAENILHGMTNMVKVAEGRINQRRVYVRVEALEPKLTQVTVQARTAGGGADVNLAHEIEKQIALKLVR